MKPFEFGLVVVGRPKIWQAAGGLDRVRANIFLYYLFSFTKFSWRSLFHHLHSERRTLPMDQALSAIGKTQKEN
jgi:hypothetical protein